MLLFLLLTDDESTFTVNVASILTSSTIIQC